MHTFHELYAIPHWQIIAGSILAVRVLNLPLFFKAVRVEAPEVFYVLMCVGTVTGWIGSSHAPHSTTS